MISFLLDAGLGRLFPGMWRKMNSLVLCVLVYAGFIVAYVTYGRFLGGKE